MFFLVKRLSFVSPCEAMLKIAKDFYRFSMATKLWDENSTSLEFMNWAYLSPQSVNPIKPQLVIAIF